MLPALEQDGSCTGLLWVSHLENIFDEGWRELVLSSLEPQPFIHPAIYMADDQLFARQIQGHLEIGFWRSSIAKCSLWTWNVPPQALPHIPRSRNQMESVGVLLLWYSTEDCKIGKSCCRKYTAYTFVLSMGRAELVAPTADHWKSYSEVTLMVRT